MSRLLCQLSYTALRAQTRKGKPPGKENDTAGQVVPPPAGRCPSPFTESNRRPSPYHGDALPTELKGQSLSAARDRTRPLTAWATLPQRTECTKTSDRSDSPAAVQLINRSTWVVEAGS